MSSHVLVLCDASVDQRRHAPGQSGSHHVLRTRGRGSRRSGGRSDLDHPQLVGLLDTIVSSGRGVGIGSLRADRVARKPDIARLLRAGGYKTLTVASDAASERLRRDISKGTKENHLIECAKLAAEHRYKVMKVYMMVGVPGETDEDIDELIRFSTELVRLFPYPSGLRPSCPSEIRRWMSRSSQAFEPWSDG